MNPDPMIEAGVELFKKLCYDTSESTDGSGVIWLNGKHCEGGGSYTKVRINRQSATPLRVIDAIGSTKNAREAIRVANMHLLKKFGITLKP